MPTIVVAFGGNAIWRAGEHGTFDEQMHNVRTVSRILVQLVAAGRRVLVTHGNGPQVGSIALQQDLARAEVPAMPHHVAGAMSQGQIGYMLQQSLRNELDHAGLDIPCATVITQVVVAADDPAFGNPTKPIGRFYSGTEADSLRRERGWTMVEDAGRGYRRVVPSPRPKDIVEWPVIRMLLESGALVIGAGGGGIPVVVGGPGRDSNELRGVDAVIDKDRAAARLGSLIGADTLVLLTDVERVAVGYGTADERWLDTVTAAEMRNYFDAGEFPAGSMGPKVESALTFVESGGARAIITSPDRLLAAVLEHGGTEVVPVGADAALSRATRVGHG